MVDFQIPTRTITVAGPEDRALLGSNPSAAAGDRDNSRSVCTKDASAPNSPFILSLSQKALNPSILRSHSTWLKLVLLTRAVCHLAISPALTNSLSIHVSEIALSCLILSLPLFVSERRACFGLRFQTFAKNLIS